MNFINESIMLHHWKFCCPSRCSCQDLVSWWQTVPLKKPHRSGGTKTRVGSVLQIVVFCLESFLFLWTPGSGLWNRNVVRTLEPFHFLNGLRTAFPVNITHRIPSDLITSLLYHEPVSLLAPRKTQCCVSGLAHILWYTYINKILTKCRCEGQWSVLLYCNILV